jgi:hypothetical protein
MLAKIKKNWKTTVAGVSSLFIGVGTLAGSFVKGSLSPEVISCSIGLITTGIGLIFGQDI